MCPTHLVTPDTIPRGGGGSSLSLVRGIQLFSGGQYPLQGGWINPWGSGEGCKLPSGSGQSPAAKRFWRIFSLKWSMWQLTMTQTDITH